MPWTRIRGNRVFDFKSKTNSKRMEMAELVLKLFQDSDRVCLFCANYVTGQQKGSKRDNLSFSEALKQQWFLRSETDIPVENSKYDFGFAYNKIRNVSLPNGI